jgi:hypothetical protein
MRLSEQRFLFALLCACIFPSQTRAAFSIEGHVVSAETNEPVPQADLKLVCLATSPGMQKLCKEITGKTLADGTFRFDSLYPLQYRLTAVGAPGMVATRWSKIEVNFGRGAASLTDVVLKLTPESTMTGRVLDETGQPKADVVVEAWRQSGSGVNSQLKLVSKTISNEKGVYVLHSLVAGNYYVATPLPHEDKNDTVNPYLFYAPDALSLEQATMTRVEIGQHYADIDLHMRAVSFFKIQGQAQTETNGSIAADQPQLRLDARDSSGVSLPGREVVLSQDGKFQTEVLPGAYTFRLTGALSLPQPKNSKTPAATMVRLLAKQDIEVSGKDLYGLMLLIPPPITVTGRAYLEGTTETNITKGRVAIRPVEAAAVVGSQTADIQPDGTFMLTNCEPTNYAVRFFPPSGTYVKSVVFNQQDVTTHFIDLSKGSGGELTIVVRQGPASIAGTISDVSGSSDADGSQKIFEVALISELWDENGLVPIRHVASKDGRFSAGGIAPGHYAAIATSGVDTQLWENAKFVHEMQARGVGVDLAENDQKQLAVPYLPLGEIDQIQYRLGID